MRRGSGVHLAVAVALLSLAAITAQAEAPALSGRVVAVNDGAGVSQAAVTLTLPDGEQGPKAITVFTDAQGRYRLPSGPRQTPERATLVARKLGYSQVDPRAGSGALEPGRGAGALTTLLYLKPVSDIAAAVPASAWMAHARPGDAKNITLTSCSSCHQLASPRMREYAAQIEAVRGGPEGDARALEEWRKVVRHEAWRTVVKHMRSLHYAVFPLESTMSLDGVDWPTAQNAALSFFSERQGEIVAQYLADQFPKSTLSLPRSGYEYGAPLGVTSRTIIREFAFPERALVRELVPAPGSPYLWGADVKRNFIVRLDPQTGATKEVPVDFKGSTGPHTIAPDDTGRLWVSMVDNDQFGSFDPVSERWRLWTLRPSSLPDTESIAGAAIVHDMSIDSRGYMARDEAGRIWLTMVGTNQLATLQPETGEVAFSDVNHIEGLSPINHLIYSAVMAEDRTHVWYSQVNGSVGCVDTRSRKVEKLVPFREGAGPRRMARDDEGNLWVALFGAGQIAKIDMASATVVATFDLPDRAAAPYAVTWDEQRRSVWVANANSDVIYRLKPESGEISVIPLPRKMAYLRQIAIDPSSGNLVAAYGNYPEGSGPSMGVVVDPGDDAWRKADASESP